MGVFLLRRLLQSVVVLFAMSLVVFAGVFAIGDPVAALIDPRSPAEIVEQTIRNLGLDRPLHEQYFFFLKNALTGNLGDSFVFGEPALKLILQRFPATLELTMVAMFIAVVVGLPLGLIAGYWSDKPVSRIIMTGSILGFSLPSFWVGLMLIILFSIELGYLPSTGRGETVSLLGFETSLLTLDGLRHILLPAINLSLFPMAMVIRLARAGVREHLQLDYVKYARAKGLTDTRILFTHVLKNIMIPVVTVMGLLFGLIIAFAVVTESVFAWPGMGKLIIDSITLLDRPVIVAYLLVTVGLFIVINLVVDILYSILDPRVRLSEGSP
ncbi:MAG: ABC transporter permease [Kiloniellales bacterium]|nr:ABC transporter permease [Kiloniellales bacterium]